MLYEVITALLADQFSVHIPTWNVLPQVVFTERVDPMPMSHLVGHAHRVLSIKPNLDGRVMISGGWRGRWDESSQTGQTLVITSYSIHYTKLYDSRTSRWRFSNSRDRCPKSCLWPTPCTRAITSAVKLSPSTLATVSIWRRFASKRPIRSSIIV